MKQILDTKYFITEDGQVYNSKSKKFLKDSINTNGYSTVQIRVRNKRITGAHVLNAIANFGYKEGMVVHHKDKNRSNNHISNLEWTTQKNNIHLSYETMSQVRNFRKCQLLFKGEVISEHKSVNEATREFVRLTGGSFSSMNKYRKVGDYEVKKV